MDYAGRGYELLQYLSEWGEDYRSGFSPEDITSNSAGIDFGQFAKALLDDCGSVALGDAYDAWARRAGVPSYLPGIDDLTALPLLDPSIRKR